MQITFLQTIVQMPNKQPQLLVQQLLYKFNTNQLNGAKTIGMLD